MDFSKRRNFKPGNFPHFFLFFKKSLKTYTFFRTFTFGVGTPIQNGVSPAIVLASTAMLGILLVVLITSGIVCIVKKLKKRVDEQQQQPNYRPI